MKTLKFEAKKRFIEDMTTLVNGNVHLPAFFDDIQNKTESYIFEIAARYMKDGKPFLYFFAVNDFDYDQNEDFSCEI